MLNSLKVSIQYILPKRLLTFVIGWFANKKAGWLTKLIIDIFVKCYKVNMEEAQQPDTAKYSTFNDFFVRALRKDARPFNTDPNVLLMPVDGIVSQIGNIKDDKILQAKGYDYSLEALLAGNYLIAEHFLNGAFITIYLPPKNYHRVHMPCNGILREMIYVPGSLFLVNRFSVKTLPNLFARNERVICLFDTDYGPMLQILVGATIVGSIETAWAGVLSPPRDGIIKRWTWPSGDSLDSVVLMKGQEMGRFNLGSTVINLFSSGKIQFVEKLTILSKTRVGQPLAFSTDISILPMIDEK